MRECEDSSLKRSTSEFREKLTSEVATCKAHDWNGTAHSLINGIKVKVMGSSHGSVIMREGLLGRPQFDSLQSL